MANNPQFKRTDKAIKQALISLLKEKPFEKITVQDILVETPVTRATFYAHFHDKYDIVETMLEDFFSILKVVKEELRTTPRSRSNIIIQKSFLNHRELLEALLKVRTENVDLRQAIAQELEHQYLAESNSPSKETEARIYAQAFTEFQLSFLYDEKSDFSLEYMNHLFISVALKLLNLSGDEETRTFLEKKMAQKW